MDSAEDSCVVGRWDAVPDYVRHTAGIPSQHVRSLAAFRLGAHHLEVATGRWSSTPRHERTCGLCGEGVGDELHMVFECDAQTVPRQMHSALFAGFGGWASPDPHAHGADSMRNFMQQDARLVASFVHACTLRASEQPPDGVLFGDPLTDATDDEFVECEDDMSDVFLHAFDSVLEMPGFLSSPP